VAGIRRKPKGKGKRALYQGWFTDHTGKRRFFTGTASRSETLRIANDAEAEHRKIRLVQLGKSNFLVYCDPFRVDSAHTIINT
jgi:hypothetical protein